MDLKDIKAIVDLMRKNSIAEFELEREGFKIRLKRSGNSSTMGANTMEEILPSVYHTPAPAAISPHVLSSPGSASTFSEIEIKAPMVGTFYRAPAPDAAPYVEIGQEIGPETVVCIIEAMKVMNEIKAEVRGVITQVLVENAKPIEFGQPLFKLRPL